MRRNNYILFRGIYLMCNTNKLMTGLYGLVLLGAQATQSDIYLGAAIVGAMILNVRVNSIRQRRRG